MRGQETSELLVEVMPHRNRQRPKRLRARYRPLTVPQILEWADAFHEAKGRWPSAKSPPVGLPLGEKWLNLDECLRYGRRGLSPGRTLAMLLVEQRGARVHAYLPPLSHKQILAWADAHYSRTGGWPQKTSGPVIDSPGDTWGAIDAMLRSGGRGLQGGTSLAQLLWKHRGSPNHLQASRLSLIQILKWADRHFDRTKQWPKATSGPVLGAPREDWGTIDAALKGGTRGLPGRDSLARLLQRERAVRNIKDLPPLCPSHIVRWARRHFRQTGRWPRATSGIANIASGESWLTIDKALRKGRRGIAGGSSLSRLLRETCGVPQNSSRSVLRVEEILRWADAHHRRTGAWPQRRGGNVQDAPDRTTWKQIDVNLSKGGRGLPGGSSLNQLLFEQRGVRRHLTSPRLTEVQILVWGDRFHARHGRWPGQGSGAVLLPKGENWRLLDYYLRRGLRGLPGGSSLAKLFADHRGTRNIAALGRLTPAVIRRWGRAYYARVGKWPTRNSGPIEESPTPADTWQRIDSALIFGLRGLPGRSSIARLLAPLKDRSTQARKARGDH